VASTVVMLTDGQVKVLREGEITEKEIKEAFR
jgi:tRNA A37 threonylcarbamoyladenosine synthetase subunit TsaC/SUA5/YrdC